MATSPVIAEQTVNEARSVCESLVSSLSPPPLAPGEMLLTCSDVVGKTHALESQGAICLRDACVCVCLCVCVCVSVSVCVCVCW